MDWSAEAASPPTLNPDAAIRSVTKLRWFWHVWMLDWLLLLQKWFKSFNESCVTTQKEQIGWVIIFISCTKTGPAHLGLQLLDIILSFGHSSANMTCNKLTNTTPPCDLIQRNKHKANLIFAVTSKVCLPLGWNQTCWTPRLMIMLRNITAHTGMLAVCLS